MDAPAQPLSPEFAPCPPAEFPGREADTDASESLCTIISDSGLGVVLWSSTPTLQTSVTAAVRLRLAPDAPAIIGRKDGGEIEYLDPRYVPTPIVPGTGKTILKHEGAGADCYVSRGHFMLRAHSRGIVLLNGVPRRGGGIRPPRNGTLLLEPERRMLEDGEELVVENGSAAAIELPNGTRLRIQAG